jgi:hypothetical protein
MTFMEAFESDEHRPDREGDFGVGVMPTGGFTF